ncbi:MAG: RHS repeat protein, partial [Blastocatellia bacterium]|nr:RHS repeat protein [Blastocatellia bacterium]
IKVGWLISLAARPLDKRGTIVNGIAAKWHCANPKIVRILNDSEAVAVGEGEAKLVVSSGNVSNEITVRVSKQPGIGNRANLPLVQDPPEQPVLSEQQAQNLVTPENNLGSPIGQTEMRSQSGASATRTRERYGSSNYSFGVPAASLPGRGMDASVGITYNSRVWNMSNFGGARTFTFNTDNNWLAPGFETGFGDLTPFGGGSVSGYMLTSPDGTRHQLLYKQASGSCSIYESTDGTFIRTTICGIYTTSTMNVVYPDGSQVMYGGTTSSGKRFPVRITDRNGNMLTIAYIQNNFQGKIAYIRDTLNRYINFHYDGEGKLVTITVPGYDGSAERQTIRFYYEDLTLQTAGRFVDTAQVIAPTTPIKVLRFVYFPGTQTGFRYDYSPYYGMIYKIWQLRGMEVTGGTSLTETGIVNGNHTIDPVNWAGWTHYNYQSTAANPEPPSYYPPLTDVPTYTWRKDDWQGRTTLIPKTSFLNEEAVTPADCREQGTDCSGTRTVTVTAPDGTKSISISKIKPTSDWENGLLDETRLVTIETSGERIWSKTKLYWEQGADSGMTGRDNPRLDKIEITNDASQTRATSFDYDVYNNQTAVREHDFAAAGVLGAELRRTETVYETGLGWIYNRLLRLPKEVKTVVGSSIVSKGAYEYDNNGEALNSLNIQYRTDISAGGHDVRYNPQTPPSGQECEALRCQDEHQCCWEVPIYQEDTRFRGNVTRVTAFADATLASDANAVVSTVKYDIAGNVVETSGSCCELKTTTYSNANHYAYPMSETRTGANAPTLSTSATYDLNTGLVKTATDENNQKATLTYNPANLRVIRTDSPNGAWSTTEYNDAVFPYHVKSTSSLEAARSVSSWSFSNGRGQGFRSRSQTANGYLSSDVDFDIMGRPVKSFNPYTVAGLTEDRPAGIKFSEVVTRDGLGRTLQSRLPDMTTVNASYSGLVATATDQAGKQRRHLADTHGRTARVDEPDANGYLGDINSPVQPTYYEYDGNNNLTKVTQTGSGAIQERVFEYDSLSRLRRERQVEASPTLDISGAKGAPAPNKWTGVYNYDTDSLLAEGFDARGVKTTFGYDGLNRVKTVAYTGETGYQTPTATYTYDEAETGFHNNARLTKVQTAANATYGTPETIQNYDYDKVGQVVKHVQSIGNQTYPLEYGYNLAGQLVSEKYPSGKIVNMTVDNFGRLSTVTETGRTYLNSVSFNDRGLLSQINLGNGTHETFGYNDRFQMTSQSLMKGAEVLQKYDYSYGTVDLANGNVNTQQNNGQLSKIEGWIGANKQWSQRFGYDELGRLKEAREYKQGLNDQLTYKQIFDFDRFGNLYRKAANNPTAGQQNPLPYTPIEEGTGPGTGDIEKTTNRFRTGTTYDDAGQVVTDNKFRSMSFAYDANGRQVKATRTGVLDAWTAYDALGNRVATKINDVWQYLIYDAFGKLVAEYGIASEGTGGVKYIQQDWQGSVRAVTNNNGFVVSRTDHQAFGEEIGFGTGLRSIEQGYSVDAATRQGYGLTERDDATGGLNHTWFRKNENRAGRWTSPDPYKGSMELGNPQSFNRYSYVVNNPTNYVDPSGLGWAIDWGSCYSEVAWNGETLYFTGREICDLVWINDGPIFVDPNPIDIGPIRTEFTRRLDQKDCRKKLNELFKALGRKTTVDAFANQFFNGTDGKQIVFGNPTNPQASASYGNGTITIRPRNAAEPANITVQGNAGNFIHELIHAAGGRVGASHREIVEDMAEVDGTKFKSIKSQIETGLNAKGLKGDAKSKAKDKAYSDLVNEWIGKHCPL